MPLPDKYEDWRLPAWLTDGSEIDPDRVGKLMFNARKEEEKFKAKIAEKESEIETLGTQLDEAKASKSDNSAEEQAELRGLRKEVKELRDASGNTRPEDQRRLDQLEVALELGLSKADSKRLVGESREELESDARQFAKDHGIQIPGDNDGDEDGEGQGGEPPSRQPVSGGQFRTGNQHRVEVDTRSDDVLDALPAL